jgi:hypothetical protein
MLTWPSQHHDKWVVVKSKKFWSLDFEIEAGMENI